MAQCPFFYFQRGTFSYCTAVAGCWYVFVILDVVGSSLTHYVGDISQVYRRLNHPLPATSHANYPFYTPGGDDKRWRGAGETEEGGNQWVGGLM